ncbi:MAG: T9SS type A sorting domain-containing protein [bacterium]|nr:T9SS type A sorting domain-containing protein [bacterium]
MKKLLLLCSAVFIFGMGARAQTAPTPTVVIDTLHYYFNKYYFKTGQTTYSLYPYYKSAASTVTNVTHCGSRFENIDTLIITGLEAFAAKHASTANLTIPVTLYLCKIDGAGKPDMPPIDSVQTSVGGSSVNKPQIIGGNFKSKKTGKDTLRYVFGDFAVLFRNMSTVSGDTVHLLRTAGATTNNMAALPSQRCSDDNYGFVRYLGQFDFTKNFTKSYGFGIGTDYEFMVAPRVKYQIVADHIVPQVILDANAGNTDTLCTRTTFTFTNKSSYQYTNRFYNLNEFYRKWNLYSAFVAQPVVGGGFSADSAITWNFEYMENALPARDPRVFLAYKEHGMNWGSIVNYTDIRGCFDANQFRARLKPMSAFGRGAQLGYNIPFTICMKYCNDDMDGISTLSNNLPNVKLYPNPMVNGSTTVSGLSGKNTIMVYDLLGQLVSKQTAEQSAAVLNLEKQPAGTYLVRIVNSENQTRSFRLINP